MMSLLVAAVASALALAPGPHAAHGLLARARVPCMSDVANLKVPELKVRLKQRGLKVSGVKLELVQRLKDDMQGGGGSGGAAISQSESSGRGRYDRSWSSERMRPAPSGRGGGYGGRGFHGY